MKLLKSIGRVVLGLLVLILIVFASLFVWWRYGDWTSRSVQDVEFVHETILRHHPGAVDPENPGFVEMMEEAYRQAMALAEKAETPADHHAALKAYTGAFNDGHLRTFTLVSLIEAYRESGEIAPLSSDASGIDIQGGRAWITIGSFSEQRASIAELTEEIEARADSLRSLDTVVFDLRGNTGGNSGFGNRIAKALWTEDLFMDWVPATAAGVDWRASPENAEHVRGIAKSYAEKGRTASAEAWTGIAESIEAAVAEGEDYARQNFYTHETQRALESPVSARVVVITDGKCASACLDFMDNLMALPDVLHIGEETGSDTQYIETRPTDSPSRFARLIVPVKVYRDRLRPADGTYVPEVAVEASGLDWDAVEMLIAEARQDG